MALRAFVVGQGTLRAASVSSAPPRWRTQSPTASPKRPRSVAARVASESKVAVVAALLANLLIAILKLVAGIVAGSSAMLAEAAHSFSDVGNQVLLLVGMRSANRPPSPKHPFGHAKAAYFWPFMVAILLFGVAGGYSLFEGIEKILHPHPLDDVRLALGVLAGSFAIECVSMFVALREARKTALTRGVTSLRQFLDENRDASLLTVLVEDGLALVSLPLAAGAILLAHYTGNPLWDGVGSCVIGALLMGFALFLASEVHGLILGRGLTSRESARVQEVFAKDGDVARVESVQTMYLGPQTALLGAQLHLRDGLTAEQQRAALARVEAALVAAVPHLRHVYLETHEPAR